MYRSCLETKERNKSSEKEKETKNQKKKKVFFQLLNSKQIWFSSPFSNSVGTYISHASSYTTTTQLPSQLASQLLSTTFSEIETCKSVFEEMKIKKRTSLPDRWYYQRKRWLVQSLHFTIYYYQQELFRIQVGLHKRGDKQLQLGRYICYSIFRSLFCVWL